MDESLTATAPLPENQRPDHDQAARSQVPPSPNRGRIWPWLVALVALIGCVYASMSTHSFVTWLDGQEHAISCSVLPGEAATTGATGCKTAMLSPYSSLFRTSLWGGLPVSLPALGVFAFLAAFAAYVGLKKDRTRHDTGFLLLATLLPVGASVFFATIAATKLGEFCNTCIGIYLASGLSLLLAIVAHVRAPSAGEGTPRPWGRYLVWFGEGVLTVGLLTGVYLAAAPAERPYAKVSCGQIVKSEDEAKILIPLHSQGKLTAANLTPDDSCPNGLRVYGGQCALAPALAVLDPLCPACRAFDRRLGASELDKRLAVDVLLYPLDSKCNWDVKTSLHPGACLISEAMLCAPESAKRILDFSFAEQERLLELGKTNEAALKAEVEQRFPEVKGCVGSNAAKAKVTRSLRWAVNNSLMVMTPQLFVASSPELVADTRLCDQDTDLGLEFTLSRMLDNLKQTVLQKLGQTALR
jgi:uncharacterized membrane protein